MEETLQTALVVDDDHLEREYLVELLLRSGFVVRDAASVPNAMALARSMRFDMVFIDDTMSGTDGAKALTEMKKSLTMWADMPKLFLLGDSHDEGAIRYRENGFSGFLDKPVELDSLLRMLGVGSQEILFFDEPTGADDTDSFDLAARAAGLNIETGIENCGTKANLVSAVEIFCSTTKTKADEIEKYYNDKDWKNYTIKVHALKSSARIIGAADLSSRAAAMEAAGDRQDIEAIDRETPRLLKDYRALSEKLSAAGKEQAQMEQKPEADGATVRDGWRSIGEFAEQMDYDLVEMVIHSLQEYRLSKQDAEKLERIRAALLMLDWDAIQREVK